MESLGMLRFATVQPVRSASGMGEKQAQAALRLIVGLGLTIPLCFILSRLLLWSSIEREFRLNLLGSLLTAPLFVTVMPVFWKGVPWQAPIAFLLLVPGILMLVSVIGFFLKYGEHAGTW